MDAYEINHMIDMMNDVAHRGQLHVEYVRGFAENVRVYYDGSMPLVFKDQTVPDDLAINIDMLLNMKEYMAEVDLPSSLLFRERKNRKLPPLIK